MLRQISIGEAIERLSEGEDVRILRPKDEKQKWKEMEPTTLQKHLTGIICFVEEEIAPAQNPHETKEDDLDELEEEDHIEEPEEVKNKKEETDMAKGTVRKKVDHGRIIALYRAGWDAKKIADDLGCSTQTVYNHIAKEDEDV